MARARGGIWREMKQGERSAHIVRGWKARLRHFWEIRSHGSLSVKLTFKNGQAHGQAGGRIRADEMGG